MGEKKKDSLYESAYARTSEPKQRQREQVQLRVQGQAATQSATTQSAATLCADDQKEQANAQNTSNACEFEVSIKKLREQIDAINETLAQALSQRTEVVRQIAKLRQQHGKSQHYDAAREQRQLSALAERHRGPLSEQALQHIFRQIFRVSQAFSEQYVREQLLGSQARKPHKTVLDFGDVTIGGWHAPVLLGGAALIESEAQFYALAEFLASRGVKVLHGGVYQPTPMPYAYQGMGVDGLILGGKIAREFDMLFMTQVQDIADIELMCEHADILQVGPAQMQHTALLSELGHAHCPVVLSRSPAASADDWLRAAEYILAAGNDELLLRECSHGAGQSLDLTSVALIKQHSHLPVVVDVSQAAVNTGLLIPLAKACLAVGADALQVTLHPAPDVALSSTGQLDFAGFEQLCESIYPLLCPREVQAFG